MVHKKEVGTTVQSDDDSDQYSQAFDEGEQRDDYSETFEEAEERDFKSRDENELSISLDEYLTKQPLTMNSGEKLKAGKILEHNNTKESCVEAGSPVKDKSVTDNSHPDEHSVNEHIEHFPTKNSKNVQNVPKEKKKKNVLKEKIISPPVVTIRLGLGVRVRVRG
jgi:uncharacterized protein YqeY